MGNKKSSDLSIAAPGCVPLPEVLSPKKDFALLVKRGERENSGFAIGTKPGWVDSHHRVLLSAEGAYSGLVDDLRSGQNRVANEKTGSDSARTRCEEVTALSAAGRIPVIG